MLKSSSNFYLSTFLSKLLSKVSVFEELICHNICGWKARRSKGSYLMVTEHTIRAYNNVWSQSAWKYIAFYGIW